VSDMKKMRSYLDEGVNVEEKGEKKKTNNEGLQREHEFLCYITQLFFDMDCRGKKVYETKKNNVHVHFLLCHCARLKVMKAKVFIFVGIQLPVGFHTTTVWKGG
jgi:hypothetical protein